MTGRQNEYFIPGDGISREVIQADICRYLGNDALVRPGNHSVRRPLCYDLSKETNPYPGSPRILHPCLSESHFSKYLILKRRPKTSARVKPIFGTII